MNPLLGERVNRQSLQPHPPVPLESRFTARSPAPPATFQLPGKPGKTGQDHGKENHLHPWRDIAEDLTGSFIQVDRKHANSWSRIAEATRLAAERFDEDRQPNRR